MSFLKVCQITIEQTANSTILNIRGVSFTVITVGAVMIENKKISMLIAEDENLIRRYLIKVIKSFNFEVVAEAENGREAVDLCHTIKPNIVLLDINMPIMTGLEALEKIHDSNPDICVIMLTSVADMQSVQKAVELGAANYILKSTPIEEFKQILINTWNAHCV